MLLLAKLCLRKSVPPPREENRRNLWRFGRLTVPNVSSLSLRGVTRTTNAPGKPSRLREVGSKVRQLYPRRGRHRPLPTLLLGRRMNPLVLLLGLPATLPPQRTPEATRRLLAPTQLKPSSLPPPHQLSPTNAHGRTVSSRKT